MSILERSSGMLAKMGSISKLLLFALILLFYSFSTVFAKPSDPLLSLNSFSSPDDYFNAQGTDPEIFEIYNEELEQLKEEITSSLAVKHFRRQREAAKYKLEPRLLCISNTDQPGCSDESDSLTVPTMSPTRNAAVFRHEFVFFSTSRLNSVSIKKGINDTVNFDQVELSEPLNVHELGQWLIHHNQHIAATLETNQALYILVTDPDGGYSRVYNYYPELKQVKLRQRIKSYGTVQDAKFFIFNRHVYLVIALANIVHSHTNCHIYRWAMAHFDVIHTLTVRGALSVDVALISKDIYIAVAQQYNEVGNEEIGTAIVKMDKFHNFENFQLLYTSLPGKVHFTRMYRETFLIIAQKERSEVFQFRDYHFVYHQTIRKLKGENLQFISLHSPDGEPFLIVSTGSYIWSYGLEDSENTKDLILDGNPALMFEGLGYDITGLSLEVTKSSDKESSTPTDYVLAVTVQSSANNVALHYIKFFLIDFHKVHALRVGSQIGEDELSLCFNKLKEKIEKNKPFVVELKELNKTILRRGSDQVFEGKFISKEGVVFSDAGAEIDHLAVNPDVEPKDQTLYSPSMLHDNIAEAIGNNLIMFETLKTSMKVNAEGNFEGIILFKNVTVREVETSALTLEKLNGHYWDRLLNQSLRASRCETLGITGTWDVTNNLGAAEVDAQKINGKDIDDIVKTETGDGESQVITAKVMFSGTCVLNNVTALNSGKLNDMVISNIYFEDKSGERPVLYGTKQAEVIEIDSNSTISYVNSMDLEQWYESCLHTQCSHQFSNATVTFYGEFLAHNLHVQHLNGMDWDIFRNDALREGQNQTIPGNPKFGNLQLHHLEVEELDGVHVNNLLNTKYEQIVASNIHAQDIVVHGSVTTGTVNGLTFRDNVVLDDENTTIHSPIEFTNLFVDEIEFASKEAALLNGIEMPFGGYSNKLVIYEIDPSLGGAHIRHLKARSAEFDVLNDNDIEVLKDELLNGLKDNIVKESYSQGYPVHDVTVKGKIITSEFNGHPLDEYLTVNAKQIDAEIHFQNNVNVQGDITFDDFATLNGVRISEWSQLVVDKEDGGHVYGVKSFEHSVTVAEGINVRLINNVPVDDYIMLRGGPGKYHLSSIQFTEILEVYQGTVSKSFTQNGTINTIDLEDLDETTISRGGECVVYDKFEFHEIEVKALFVGSTFNQYNVNDIIEHSVLLDANNTYIMADIVIQDSLICEDNIEIEYLNEVMPTVYFKKLANRNEDENIKGMKRFFGSVQMDSDLKCEHHLMNNINLTAITQEYVSTTKPQKITGDWKIEHLEVEDFNFESVCRVVPDKEFVNIESSERQEMDGSVKFGNADVRIFDIEVMKTSTLRNSDFNSLSNERGGLSLHSLKCRDVKWNSPNNVPDGLNDFMKYGVRASAERQEIDGPIMFIGPVKAAQLNATYGINGIDLENIRTDGVLKDEQYEHLVLAGDYHIRKIVLGSEGVIKNLQTFDTRSLNGMNLLELNDTIVRKNGTVPIRGYKALRNSIDVEHLFVKDINGCLVNNIAEINSEDKIAHLHLDSLSGVQEINFDDCNLFEWGLFFDNVVLNGNDEVIYGYWEFLDGLHVEDFNATFVNDVHLESAVKDDSMDTQIIYGRKEFKNINSNGNIEAKEINGYKIEEIQPTVVRRNGDHVFKTPVHMDGATTFRDGLEVGTINGYKLKEVPTTLEDHHTSIAAHENSSSEGLQRLNSMIQGLNEEIPRTSVWFDYYSKKKDIFLKSISVDAAGGQITFLDYFRVKDNECGLPKGCAAPVTSKAEYSSGTPFQLVKSECERSFNLPFGPNASLELRSQSVSYNESCRSTNDGGAFLNIQKAGENFNVKLVGHGPLSSIFAAKTFISNGAEYLLLSETVVPDNETPMHSILCYVLETSDGESSFNLIQTIETAGISPIDVKNFAGHWFLAIGRSTMTAPRSSSDLFDYEELTDRDENSKSEIYVWAECTKASPCQHGYQFQLLRLVGTGSVVDVELFSVTNSRGIEEVFATFVSSGNSVDILKYDYDFHNFMVYQSINFGSNVILTSVSSFKVRNILYVIFSSIPDGIFVYEYLCVEGFKLQLTVPADEVREVESFYINKEIFMVATGPVHSFMAKAVIQGQNSL